MTTSRAVKGLTSMSSHACLASFHLALVVTSFNQLEPDCLKPAAEAAGAAKAAEEENINMHEI